MTIIGFGVNPDMVPGPSAWYRVFGPANMLAEDGVCDVIVGTKAGVSGDVAAPIILNPIGTDLWAAPDAVVFHYTAVPAPAIERARASGQRVYFDLDDDLWAVPDYNTFAAKVRSDAIKLAPVMRACTAVLCSTPTLAAVCAAETGARTLVAPNIYDPARWPVRPVREQTTDAPLVVGWHGLCRTSGDDVKLIGDLMRPLLEADPDLVFRHVGAETPDDFATMADLPADRVDSRPGVPMAELHTALEFDIGLVVRANNGFNRSRTNTKGFELAASGIPVVAVTDIAEYVNTPFLVEPDAFAARIRELVDPAERVTASADALAWVADVDREHRAGWPTLDVCGEIRRLALSR